jgi:3-mercaptopyruvate sulfurtransferase SseA
MKYRVVNGKNIFYGDIYHRLVWKGTMMVEIDMEMHWQERAKGLLKGELKRRGVSYRQLAEKLEDLGVHETDRNIANKLARGGFSAVFMIQCLEAIGCEAVRLHG